MTSPGSSGSLARTYICYAFPAFTCCACSPCSSFHTPAGRCRRSSEAHNKTRSFLFLICNEVGEDDPLSPRHRVRSPGQPQAACLRSHMIPAMPRTKRPRPREPPLLTINVVDNSTHYVIAYTAPVDVPHHLYCLLRCVRLDSEMGRKRCVLNIPCLISRQTGFFLHRGVPLP